MTKTLTLNMALVRLEGACALTCKDILGFGDRTAEVIEAMRATIVSEKPIELPILDESIQAIHMTFKDTSGNMTWGMCDSWWGFVATIIEHVNYSGSDGWFKTKVAISIASDGVVYGLDFIDVNAAFSVMLAMADQDVVIEACSTIGEEVGKDGLGVAPGFSFVIEGKGSPYNVNFGGFRKLDALINTIACHAAQKITASCAMGDGELFEFNGTPAEVVASLLKFKARIQT
jgi:hypothetical protein